MKKEFDHVEHRAAFKAMRDYKVALVAAIWSGICMKARLGTVLSNKVQMSRGLPQGAPESPVILIMTMELILRDLVYSWQVRNLAWSLDDFVLSAICYADGRSDRKIDRSGCDSWCREKTLDKLPEDGGRKFCGGWLGCVMGRGTGICGIEGVFVRNCAARDCAQVISSELGSSWLPRKLRLSIVKSTMWQAFRGARACG